MYLLFIYATGRNPNTKRLNLEAVGVELDQAGAVKVHIILKNTFPRLSK